LDKAVKKLEQTGADSKVLKGAFGTITAIHASRPIGMKNAAQSLRARPANGAARLRENK
jgi:hypothetical protein